MFNILMLFYMSKTDVESESKEYKNNLILLTIQIKFTGLLQFRSLQLFTA